MMKPHEIEAWGKSRRGGRTRFLLLYGLLMWGVPMFLLEMFWLDPGPKPPAMIALSAIIWGLGSLLYGYVLWRFCESRFMKALARRRA
jgi:hypothetical protein